MSVARFVVDQKDQVPGAIAFTCLVLGLSISWFTEVVASSRYR